MVRFVTPVFHPNIDERGRICLDTLKAQPQVGLKKKKGDTDAQDCGVS